ncbi:rod shape-determining protein RodA [Patescibacteria group bacterium]|jgi:rod shape determining protein RodA|nr:rod shape-determining protein RodA [Patescibacteria group bacterium]
MRRLWVNWRKLDWFLFLAVIILLLLSCSILYSLNLNIENSTFVVFKKQIFFVFSGLALFFLFAKLNYSLWSTYSKVIFFVFILALVLVLVFGTQVKGTTGWLRLGPLGVQPVEFAKIALIIFLARYFSLNAQDFKLFRHIFFSGLATFVFVALVMLQPDLGSALVLLGTWVIMLLFTGIQKKHLLWLTSSFVLVSTLAWFWLLKPYQKDRILTFINPSLDPMGSGYNVIQSMIAVGSGQLTGRGLALGSQSNLHFLPEPGTDFIFSVIAENLGFLGVTLVLALFTFIFYRLLLIMRKSQDNFAGYFILGVVAMLLVQLFINIGMNMGISPVTGIPLPLLSAGGSSIWAIMIALGIAQNIKIRST